MFRNTSWLLTGALILLSTLLSLTTPLSAQTLPWDDPYLDPEGAKPLGGRADKDSGLLLGFGYGLHPMYVPAPPLVLGWYQDPVVFGVESSDTDQFQVLTKERLEAFGTSRFRNTALFGKYFLGSSLLAMVTLEERRMDLWDRTFNRTQGSASFDQHLKATVATGGLGFMSFSNYSFFGVDVLRYAVPLSESAEVVEHYETWTLISGTREELDQNIAKRNETWLDLLKVSSGFVIYWGFWF